MARDSPDISPVRSPSAGLAHRSSQQNMQDLLKVDLLSLDGSESRAQASPTPAKQAVSRTPRRSPSAKSKDTFVLAIDYGTTRTGVGFALGSKPEIIQDWGMKMDNEIRVRSAISYSNPGPGNLGQSKIQWGFAIGDKRVAMVNTKLEIEPQKERYDELDLTYHVLRGTGFLKFANMVDQGPSPAFSCKPPVNIIGDYLEQVYLRVSAELKDTISSLPPTGTPMDLVITIPVDWSYEAQDAIFKAVRRAGFNYTSFPTLRDIILISEPEAASYYTARHLRDTSTDCFEEGETFVLCDAGGGTVDVVSFKVEKLRPELVLRRVTEPQGGKFGSALIDLAFKTWLRKVIGNNHYAEIDPANADASQQISPHAAETGAMRELIRRFNREKHKFSMEGHDNRDVHIELPPPLKSINVEDRIESGHLIIHRHEMKGMMDPCVNGVIKLIKSQLAKVAEAKQPRVWNLLLVGGFGASPYLKQILERILKREKPPIGVHVPDEAAQTTAVVKGAVIYGQEKRRHKCIKLAAITRSYGLSIGDKFHWLIRAGDLARPREIYSERFSYNIGSRRDPVYDLTVYQYNYRNEEDDYVPDSLLKGINDVSVLINVRCDFSQYALSRVVPRPGHSSPASGRRTVGPLRWRLRVTANHMLEAEVVHEGSSEFHEGAANIVGVGKAALEVESQEARPPSKPSEMSERDWWVDASAEPSGRVSPQ